MDLRETTEPFGVFPKSIGVQYVLCGTGGRASTRRTDDNQFDHGCQFIRVTSEGLHTLLQDLEAAGTRHDDRC
jgi:predicted NAD/FAD-dependent oxidoreductase